MIPGSSNQKENTTMVEMFASVWWHGYSKSDKTLMVPLS
jgi:hypothetical protein